MKPIYLLSTLFLFSLRAQAPVPVPLAHGDVPGEPHHHLKIENAYVRAYYVEVAPHESTQLHQHDHDYIFVTLGASDVTNAVLGKPEVHLQLKDGEVHFTRGGFAHVARNNSDAPFRNVTIEFLRPQGDAHNRCETVVANAPRENCDDTNEIVSGMPIPKELSNYAVPAVPPMGVNRRSLFETDGILVQEWVLGLATSTLWGRPEDALVVGLGPSAVNVVSGKEKAKLGPGQMFWLVGGRKSKFASSSSEPGGARFLVISFKESGSSTPAPKS